MPRTISSEKTDLSVVEILFKYAKNLSVSASYLVLLNSLENMRQDSRNLHVSQARLDLIGVGEEPNAVDHLFKKMPANCQSLYRCQIICSTFVGKASHIALRQATHLVDKLGVAIVVLQEGDQHVQALGLVEYDAALVITKESLHKCRVRNSTRSGFLV